VYGVPAPLVAWRGVNLLRPSLVAMAVKDPWLLRLYIY